VVLVPILAALACGSHAESRRPQPRTCHLAGRFGPFFRKYAQCEPREKKSISANEKKILNGRRLIVAFALLSCYTKCTMMEMARPCQKIEEDNALYG
jgi:hypothetical protein